MYGAGDGARPAGIRRASSLSAIPGKVQLRRFGAGLDLHCGELLEPLFWRACLAELVGTTLFLFFAVSSIVYRGLFSLAAVVPGVPTITESNYGSAARSSIAWTFGLAIFVLVFIFSPVSGANLNPAVSLGLAVLRKITVVRFAAYTIAQCLGATLGTLIARHIEPAVFSRQSGGINALSPEINPSGAFLAEFMGTFLLVTVVLCAIDESRKLHTLPYLSILAPFAAGMAVTVIHLALIPIDGCGINPARSFGPALVTGIWKDQWVFWIGPWVGAVAAALLHGLVFSGENRFENVKNDDGILRVGSIGTGAPIITASEMAGGIVNGTSPDSLAPVDEPSGTRQRRSAEDSDPAV
ncbi:hypothetical protein TeGR_g3969 [Tetraparma gracilis]|uniref:Aquaporin n=1 Tax=Tetraparma gracilis TaxID=2962635 RepID=A0ABQ6MWX1_9STRA|nr:hypothetical protein TeGR_g3969 [Tetraparma gracilis]